MKSYEGEVNGDGTKSVFVIEGRKRRPLPWCVGIRSHSPEGFDWGYGGSGSAQLALAILVDLVGEQEALVWYQPFKWREIAQLKRTEPWSLSEKQIRDVLTVLKAETGGAG